MVLVVVLLLVVLVVVVINAGTVALAGPGLPNLE